MFYYSLVSILFIETTLSVTSFRKYIYILRELGKFVGSFTNGPKGGIMSMFLYLPVP